jgi:aspartate/methionine/tyrosine aminotransferase
MSYVPIIANKLTDIPFAGIRKVFQRANEIEAQGKKVIHFEIGRPDFDTPSHIKEAAKIALDKGYVHYAPNNGLLALREALAMRLSIDKGLSYDYDKEIMVTAGGQEALYLTFLSLLNAGDEVIIPDPSFGPFALAIQLAGGIPVKIPLEADENFAYDLSVAKRALTRRTKAILVNSPHNPTGGFLTKEQLKEVADFAVEHDLILISDEAYDKLVYEGTFVSPASFPGMQERTVICGTLSKTYAMTGWRIGYIAAPEAIIGAAIRLQQNIMLSLCTFAQHGAIAALTGPQECVESMVKEFARRRLLVLDMLKQIPGLELTGIPQGAFYAFPRITLPHVTSVQVVDYLLDHAGVAVVDGLAFGEGGRGHFRLSYAVSFDDCRIGLERIGEAMRVLRNL